MKDAYTFDRDFAGLDAIYPHFYQAIFNIFNRCELDTVAVKSDTGMMGGKVAHEFMAITPIGEDTLVILRRVPATAPTARLPPSASPRRRQTHPRPPWRSPRPM